MQILSYFFVKLTIVFGSLLSIKMSHDPKGEMLNERFIRIPVFLITLEDNTGKANQISFD